MGCTILVTNTVLAAGCYLGETIRRNASRDFAWTSYSDYFPQHPSLMDMVPESARQRGGPGRRGRNHDDAAQQDRPLSRRGSREQHALLRDVRSGQVSALFAWAWQDLGKALQTDSAYRKGVPIPAALRVAPRQALASKRTRGS